MRNAMIKTSFPRRLPEARELAQLGQRQFEELLGTNAKSGLAQAEAGRRNRQFGWNELRDTKVRPWLIVWRQLTSNPLTLILSLAAAVSFFTGDPRTGAYVLVMIGVGVGLGFWNEWSAERTVAALLRKVSLTAVVLRDGQKTDVPAREVTIGDILFLTPGNIVPADVRLIETDGLEINEAALTGESAAAAKRSEPGSPGRTQTARLPNLAFMGTEIMTGSGTGVVIGIGRGTQFGTIAETVSFVRPPTQFQQGLVSFGGLMVRIIIGLTALIFLVNTLLGRDPLVALLFALAVAVGLTPELLPVIVTVGLARGAGKLARHGVVTKQLIAIENLGNMDVLCTDKTGTLTEGNLTVLDLIDGAGRSRPELLDLALLSNLAIRHHKLIGSSIDVAVWEYALARNHHSAGPARRLAAEPFNYRYGFAYTVVDTRGQRLLIINGAPDKVLAACRPAGRAAVAKRYQSLSRRGYHLSALATAKLAPGRGSWDWKLARNLDFRGFILLSDIPKASARAALEELARLNVTVKVITGDNELVARHICAAVGLPVEQLLTGKKLDRIHDKHLALRLEETNLIAEVSPEQKLRIIETLRTAGHTVGYLGDGINDAPALHAADVGISVNSAVDVAKEAAQVVLLQKSLAVLANGITEGRRTFMNVVKYVLMGSGSNFGEMLSAAGASFFLPFLPMTPPQILLENGLYDVSQIPIAGDTVDAALLQKPKHWDIGLIYRFMLFFGMLSTLSTVATFAVMLWMFHAEVAVFRTAWFLESLTTEMAVVLVIRTTRIPFFRNLPSRWFGATIIAVLALGFWLPLSPLAASLGFGLPPAGFYTFLALLVVTYIGFVELVKKYFLEHFQL